MVRKIANITVSVKPEEVEASVRAASKMVVSGWEELEDADIKVTEFTGGITNKLYRASVIDRSKVENGNNPTYSVLVRIYGNHTEKLIDRKAELDNIEQFHQAGLGAKLYGSFNNGYIYEYFEGKALQPQDLVSGKLILKIAEHMGVWHKVHIPGNKIPSLWTKIKSWIDLIPESYQNEYKDNKAKELPKSKLQTEFQFLEEQLSKVDSPIVFTHNDLLAPNIIYNPTKDTIRFIDYEYASYNYRGFDLGNHFCEFAGFDLKYENYPDKSQQIAFLTSYFKSLHGRESSDEELNQLYIEANTFALAAHFFWGTWALIQAHISDIDFDFMEYGLARFRQYFKVRDDYLALNLSNSAC